MSKAEYDYLLVARQILNQPLRKGRTKEKYRSVFAPSLTFRDVKYTFPLLTTKHIPYRLVFEELMWFINGKTNVKYLQEKNVHIWNEWANPDGSLGRTYGAFWIEQLPSVLYNLRDNAFDRRHLVVSWEAGIENKTNLPPCHMLYQFYVEYSGTLSIQVYQRSADWFLGVPFNIASYATLLNLVASVLGYKVGDLHMTFGDAHIYENHEQQMFEQITRVPRGFPKFDVKHLPTSDTKLYTTLRDIQFKDVTITGYDPYPKLKGEVAV